MPDRVPSMNSSLPETETVAEDDKKGNPELLEDGGETTKYHDEQNNTIRERINELLEVERSLTSVRIENGVGSGYRNVQGVIETSEDGSSDQIPRWTGSPAESLLSILDDAPSVQV